MISDARQVRGVQRCSRWAKVVVGIALLALIAPSAVVGPLAVQQRDLQVRIAARVEQTLPTSIELPTLSPVWSPADRQIARAVEGVTGRSFHRHVRIMERHIDAADGTVPVGAGLIGRPSGHVATERAWGVGPRPSDSDPPADETESAFVVVGRYRPGEDLVELDPDAPQLRTAVLAHELAHALADQHGGVNGGNRLATEGFAGLVERRIVAHVGARRPADVRIAAQASYRDLSEFWLPYVAAPLAFEVIEQALGAAGIWSALRERSGQAVLTPHRWTHARRDVAHPTPPALPPVDDLSNAVSLRPLDPGHWLILLGQYHDVDIAVPIAASIVETVEFAYTDVQGRSCLVATALITDRRASWRLRRSLVAWAAEHDSREVAALDATALQVAGCDPGPRSRASWLDPSTNRVVQQHIDELRGLARDRPVFARHRVNRRAVPPAGSRDRGPRAVQVVRDVAGDPGSRGTCSPARSQRCDLGTVLLSSRRNDRARR